MATIDNLDIQITADASKASAAINSLVASLTKLDSALSSSYGSSLTSMAVGIQSLGVAMASFRENASASTFTSLAKSLEKVQTIDTSNFSTVANAVNQLVAAVNSTATASGNVQNVSSLVNGLGKLGGVQINRAITNLPLLENALMQLITTLSKAPAVSSNVVGLVNSIANLASQGSKMGSMLNSSRAALNNINTSAKKTTISFKGLASQIGKFYATYFLTIRGIKKLWESVESAMDYVETYNYFSVTMSKIGKDTANQMGLYGEEAAEAYTDSFTNKINELTQKMTGYNVGNKGELNLTDTIGLGLDPNQLMNFEAKVSAITNAVGLMGKTSTDTAKALSMLSADISSLTNTDLDTVMSNLSSGLVGQSKALYKYGIDITQATLETYALANGVTKTVSTMTQSEKMQLRLLAILDQSKVSWGDMANTVNSVANQYRVLKQQFSNLTRTIGNLFLPIVQAALPVINGMVVALNRLFTALGYSLWGDNWLTQLQDGISGGVATELEDVADEADDASASVKKLNDNLQGFDEINKLTADSDTKASNYGDGTGLIDLSDEISASLKGYETVWDKALKSSTNKINKFADKFEKALEPVRQLFTDVFNGDYYAAGADTGKIIMSLYNDIADIIEKVNWRQLGEDFANYFNGLFKSIKGKDVANGINVFVNAVWDTLCGFFKNIDTKELFRIIKDIFLNLDWTTIAKLGLTVAGLKLATTLVSTFSSNLKTGLTSVLSVNSIGAKATTASKVLGSTIGGWIGEGITSPLMLIPATVGGILLAVSNHYADMADKFEEAQGKISDSCQDFLDAAKTVRDNAQEVFDTLDKQYDTAGQEDTSSLQILVDRYFDLAKNVGDSKEKLEQLEAYKKQLIDANPEFQKILDDTTTSYEQQRDAIQGIIDNLIEKAKIEAASDIVSQQATTIYGLQEEAGEQYKEWKAAQKKQSDLNKTIQEKRQRIKELMAKENEYTHDEWIEVEQEVRKLLKEVGSADFNQSVEIDWGAEFKVGSLVKDFNSLGKETTELKDTYDKTIDQIDEATHKMDYYAGIASGAIKTTTTYAEYMDGVYKSTTTNIETYTKKATSGISDVNAGAAACVDGITTKTQQAISEIPKMVTPIQSAVNATFKNTSAQTGSTLSYVLSQIDTFVNKVNKKSATVTVDVDVKEEKLKNSLTTGFLSTFKTTVPNNTSRGAFEQNILNTINSGALNNIGVTVTLAGDAASIFNVVQTQTNKNSIQFGK